MNREEIEEMMSRLPSQQRVSVVDETLAALAFVAVVIMICLL